MKHKDGFIELGALIILLFLSVILSTLVIYFSAVTKNFQRNNHEQKELKEAELLLDNIVTALQPLKDYEYDDINNDLLLSIQFQYAQYNLCFEDISSGYHLDFLSDADLSDTNIAKFIFNTESPGQFISWRNVNGLTTDKNLWKLFVKENAFPFCAAYGWLHHSQDNTFAYRTICQDYNTNNTETLFPLVNDFPMININMVIPDVIEPIILRYSKNIPEVKKKLDIVKTKLLQNSMTLTDISSTFEIPMTHVLFAYLGSKTAFWRIYLDIRQGMKMEAIVAAIPEKNGNIQEIEKYSLIDRRIIYVP